MTTVYCVAPTTGFSAVGYKITAAGTVVDPSDLPLLLSEAQMTGANLSLTGGGVATTYVPTSRFLKSTTGAPTTGAWSVGDEVQDSAGFEWHCTVAGSPGTWVVGATSTSLDGGTP